MVDGVNGANELEERGIQLMGRMGWMDAAVDRGDSGLET